MPRARSIFLALVATLGTVSLSGACADTVEVSHWSFEEPTEIRTQANPFPRACLVYVGGHDRLAIVGDADAADACIVIPLVGDGQGRKAYPSLEVSPDTWSVGGFSVHPRRCVDVPENRENRESVAVQRAAGPITFAPGDSDSYRNVSVDLRVALEDPPAGLPLDIHFSATDLPVEFDGPGPSCGLGNSPRR